MRDGPLDARMLAGIALGVLIGAFMGISAGFAVAIDARAKVREAEVERSELASAWLLDQSRLAQCSATVRVGEVLAELEADNYGRAYAAAGSAIADLRAVGANTSADELESVSFSPDDRRQAGPELSVLFLDVREMYAL